jgi:transcriptional regulator with XRE-family HTH domain
MYRDRLDEIRREKGYSTKKWAEESGVSADTLDRIVNPENPEKDSPRVNTLEKAIEPFGVELWELFYTGDKSFVALQAELANLKNERDELIAENAVLKDNVRKLTEKVDFLRDDLVDICKNYMKERTERS